MKLIMENWRNYLLEQTEINTVGDLKKILDQAKSAKALGQGKEAIKDLAVGAIIDVVPGLGTAKSLFDVFKSTYSLPDEKRTGTALDVLDVDDEVSAIVDDNVENAFLKKLESEASELPDETPLANLNMTRLLAAYLRDEFNQRTVVMPKEKK